MRLLARLALLALLVSGLAVPFFAAPSQAAINPDCRRSYENTTAVNFPGLFATSKITVPGTVAGNVADVNVTVTITHEAATTVSLELAHAGKTVAVINTGHAGSNFTSTVLDDDTSVALTAGTAPYTGTFRPDNPLSGFDGLALAGDWTLTPKDSNGLDLKSGTLTSWSIFLRVANCDYDGDGMNDEVDNCPDLASTNTRDWDGDKLGEPCDPDDDNDTVPDTSDNCHYTRNSNQADADRDGDGDVCDTNDDNDKLADDRDHCDTVYALTWSGCKALHRSLSFKWADGKFKGRLYSRDEQRCYAFREVYIWKVRSGPDLRLGVAFASVNGYYKLAKAKRHGKYYATANPAAIRDVGQCDYIRSVTRSY